MSTEKNALAIVIRAYTPEQVAEMLQEKVEAINRHCRLSVVRGEFWFRVTERRWLVALL